MTLTGLSLALHVYAFIICLLLVFLLLPSVLGVSVGLRELYVRTLLRIFQWATGSIERGSQETKQPLYKSTTYGLIKRKENCSLQYSKGGLRAEPCLLVDIFMNIRCGVESIVEDDVTTRFSAEELESWNLLTRTNCNFHHLNFRLTIVWFLGVCVRYVILLPFRIFFAVLGMSWLVIGASLVGFLPGGTMKDWLSESVHLTSCRILARSLSAVIRYHNTENRPRKGGICVANHTSPIDVIILAADRCYAMVGQVQGGLLGLLERSVKRACSHVWFERSEIRDRHLVTKRLQEHIADKKKLPILIFPEGTCINNTSVMMFKKGSFEIGGVIYPVAIKYDPQFGDAFWNSSQYGIVTYLLRMMSSWAIVCDVWYLPPVTNQVRAVVRCLSSLKKWGK
uniref:glycerol-3-phosphate acyltransferase 3-like isoform X1 n=1 Tax=Myxine glutinosa TaxID=7769 RepID=UPI00358E854C